MLLDKHATSDPAGASKVRDPRDSTKSATFTRAADFICRNLRSTDLSPAMIAVAIGVSRAVLYREFAGVGGVSAHIQDVRISRARVYLQSHAHRRGVVSEACESFGYASMARFTRLFRQRHHETPVAFVERVRATTQGSG